MYTLKDFDNELKGSSGKKRCYGQKVAKHLVIGYKPLVKSKHFEFHFKIKNIGAPWLRFGVGGGEQSEDGWLGTSDRNGWTIGHDGQMFRKGSIGSKMDTFSQNDTVGMIVDKNQKKIYYLKNGINLGSIPCYEGNEFPEELQICCCSYYTGTEFELVRYEDHSGPPPPKEPTKEELVIEKLILDMKKLEEKVYSRTKVDELMKKQKNEFMKYMDEKLPPLINENEKLKEEIEKMKKNHLELHDKHETLKLEHQKLNKDYFIHHEKFHTVKYELDELSFTPTMKKVVNEEFFCFGGKFEMEMKFNVFSAGVMDETNPIDFAEIKIFLNSEPLKEINRMPRSVELEIEFEKVGRNEVLVEFENIKKIFIVNVSSGKVSQENTQLYLRKENTKELGNRYSKSEEIEILVQFKNEEGLDLPFNKIPDLEMSYVVNSSSNSKKKVSRGFIEIEEEHHEGNGVIIGGSFAIKNSGEFQIKVIGEGFSKKKEFKVL